MSDDQNDVGLVNEAKVGKVVDKPCIKRLMEEGAGGECRKDAMCEVAKYCYRQKMDKEAALAVLLECNNKNTPPLLEQELTGISHSIYATTGDKAIDCDNKSLKGHCNKEACQMNGNSSAIVPEPARPIAPLAVTVVSELVNPPALSFVKPQIESPILYYLPEGWLKEYVRFALPLTEASVQYHLATALAIVATVLGRKVCLCAGASTYYPNLYIVVLGASGITRKSTAINLYEWFLPAINPHYMLSGNIMSVEGLFEAFQTSPVHIVVYDELKNLAVNASKPYGRGLISTFTSLWTCPKFLRIDVKKVPPDKRFIFQPTLNILAATTTEWLDLKEGDLHGGFWGRFLLIVADENDHRRLPIQPPADEALREKLLEWLLAMHTMPNSQYTWQQDAQEYYVDIYNNLRDAFSKERNKSYIEPFWSRIGDHIIKLAMIFDAASYNPTLAITKDNLERAKGIMDVITGYYREILNRATFSKQEKKERQVMDILQKADPKLVSHSEIMHDLHLNAGEMRQVITSLEQKEHIDIDDITTVGAKKSKRQYRLKR